MIFDHKAVEHNTTLTQLQSLNIHQELLQLGHRLEAEEVDMLILIHRVLLAIVLVLRQMDIVVEQDLQPHLALLSQFHHRPVWHIFIKERKLRSPVGKIFP